MAYASEVLPIVVDPNHERFGYVGEMIVYDQEFGNCLIKFEDGEETVLNDGLTTGIPQFVAPMREHEAGVRRLQNTLPDIRANLVGFAGEIVEPVQSQANEERNNAARAGFIALVNSVLFESAEAQS